MPKQEDDNVRGAGSEARSRQSRLVRRLATLNARIVADTAEQSALEWLLATLDQKPGEAISLQERTRHQATLKRRIAFLEERIAAAQNTRRDVSYDRAELSALTWALEEVLKTSR